LPTGAAEVGVALTVAALPHCTLAISKGSFRVPPRAETHVAIWRTRKRPRIPRIGWFRSVSNIPRAFAVQSMVAEIAQATNRDQKDMHAHELPQTCHQNRLGASRFA
jgi:hypothetical protein